jgi:hypothetical protein
MRGKIGQRFVDRDRQRDKLLEVLVVRRPLFRLFPDSPGFSGKILDR